MRFILKVFLTIFLHLLSIPTLLAEELKPTNPFQKDFLLLVASIKKYHCGIYPTALQVMSLQEFDSATKSVFTSLETARSSEDFYFAVAPFVCRLQDGHSRININFTTSLGIGCWWFQDKLTVVSVASDQNRDLIGKEIVSIGHLSVADIEQSVNLFIASDPGQRHYQRLFSPDFMMSKTMLNHLKLLHDQKTASVTFSVDGELMTRKIQCHFPSANTRIQVPRQCRNKLTAYQSGNWYENVEGKNALYVQLNSLPQQGYREFWRAVFQKAKQDATSTIILDLRNNTGGYSLWCNEFLSYLVPEPRSLSIYQGWRSVDSQGNPLRRSGSSFIKPVATHFGNRVPSITLPETKIRFAMTFVEGESHS